MLANIMIQGLELYFTSDSKFNNISEILECEILF